MLIDLIEHTRKEMLIQANTLGFTSPIAVSTSQKLDYLLNLYQKSQKRTAILKSAPIAHPGIMANIIDGCGVFSSTLKKSEYGLIINEKDKWVSLHEIKSILNYLDWMYGDELLYYIGSFGQKNCVFPEEINSFESALLTLNSTYQMNHIQDRNSTYETYFLDRKEIIVNANMLAYSNHVVYGFIKGLAEKFHAQITSIKEIKSENGGQFQIKLK